MIYRKDNDSVQGTDQPARVHCKAHSWVPVPVSGCCVLHGDAADRLSASSKDCRAVPCAVDFQSHENAKERQQMSACVKIIFHNGVIVETHSLRVHMFFSGWSKWRVEHDRGAMFFSDWSDWPAEYVRGINCLFLSLGRIRIIVIRLPVRLLRKVVWLPEETA